jgi:putative heme-binding domain-containing protein
VTHEFELLRSTDPLFRPCQMVTGPDGAMYVCDWRTDSGGAGKLWGDGKHGRIYRVSWKGTKVQPGIDPRGFDSWAKIAKQSSEDLVKTLESDNFTDRERARHELARRGAKEREGLLEVLKDENGKPASARIAALGALQSMWNDDVRTTVIERLGDLSPDIRRLAADALALNCKKGDRNAHEALEQQLGDLDLAARRAAYMAIGKLGAAGAGDVIVNGIQFDKRQDDYFTDGLARALEYVGKDAIAKLLALSDSGSETDLERVVEVFPTLRTRAAADKIPTLLKNYHLKPEQKIALIRAYLYCQVDPPVSVEPLLRFLDELPKEPTKTISEAQLNGMKLAALDVLAAHGAIKSEIVKTTLTAMLKTTDMKTHAALLQTIGNARLVSAAPVLLDQLQSAANDNDRVPFVRTLGQLGDPSAFKPLQEYLYSRDANLRIETLRALSNIDHRPARKFAESLLGDEDLQVQRDAIAMLGQSVEGARVVGKRFADKKLPRSLLPEVADALRRFSSKEHPDVGELLSRVVKGGLLVSLDPTELKRVSDMVKEQGDPERGRALYLNNKAVACIMCHRLEGVGGNAGPDLTRVWDTASLEKVMESMLDPSKEIKEGYQTYVATTKSGLIFTGLKITQNAEGVVLRDTTGKEVRIVAADLDTFAASKKSLMPDDVVRHLSIGEFIDLVAFLRDRKSQEELRGFVLTAWAIGPLDFDLTKPHALEKNPDPNQTIITPDRQRLPWRQVQADITGKGFDLRGVLGRAPAAGYVLAYVHSPKAQKAQLQLQSDETVKLSLNGKGVEVKEDAAPLALNEGWNTLLLRLNNAEGVPFLSARIVGADSVRIALQKD